MLPAHAKFCSDPDEDRLRTTMSVPSPMTRRPEGPTANETGFWATEMPSPPPLPPMAVSACGGAAAKERPAVTPAAQSAITEESTGPGRSLFRRLLARCWSRPLAASPLRVGAPSQATECPTTDSARRPPPPIDIEEHCSRYASAALRRLQSPTDRPGVPVAPLVQTPVHARIESVGDGSSPRGHPPHHGLRTTARVGVACRSVVHGKEAVDHHRDGSGHREYDRDRAANHDHHDRA